MPRAVSAATTPATIPAITLAMTLAMIAGAAAQAVPGAADVGEYHERYVVDANPYERSPRSGAIVEEALTGARAAPDIFVLEESVVMGPLPAAMPEPPRAAALAAGLTPGVPTGSDAFTDSKRVVGER